MAKWGNKGFLISPEKIVPILSMSTGFARKSDENEDTSGTPTTNTRGMELQEIELETRYLLATGTDPRAQIEDWKKQFGLRFPLHINGQQFGPDLMELDSVDFSNFTFDNRGRLLQVDAAIKLVEYVPPTTTVSSKQGETAEASNAGAMSAGASSDDKAARKTTTAR